MAITLDTLLNLAGAVMYVSFTSGLAMTTLDELYFFSGPLVLMAFIFMNLFYHGFFELVLHRSPSVLLFSRLIGSKSQDSEDDFETAPQENELKKRLESVVEEG